MKFTANELIDLLNDATKFRLHLDRLSLLENVAKETNAKAKREKMLRLSKDACMWTPDDPSNNDLARLYALARAAVVAEGTARTADFRKKFDIEISTLALSDSIVTEP